MEALFNSLPVEALRGMIKTAELKLRSRTGFLINKLQQLQQQGVPFQTAMSNPEIVALLTDLQTSREALHLIAGILQRRGGSGLVGSGLWEQIQHHGRVLDATVTKRNKLRQKRARLVAIADVLEQKLPAMGQVFEFDNPKVRRIVDQAREIDNQLNGLENKLNQLTNLILQLHEQLENQPVVQDENA
jgi:hypothetical protein